MNWEKTSRHAIPVMRLSGIKSDERYWINAYLFFAQSENV